MTGSIAMWVRGGNLDDASACADIVAALPDYFSADVPDKVRNDMASHDSWVVVEDDQVKGFAIVARRRAEAAEILWAATSAERRGQGIGTALIEHVLRELRNDDAKLVEVKTLDPSANYAPYAGTYAFWTARGFVHVDTIDPLPGWEPGNPCAILVAALVATR